MTSAAKSPYAGYRFPGEVISHAVWLYFRFPLSLRMVEEMLAARGIEVSHETVRQWARNFNNPYLNNKRIEASAVRGRCNHRAYASADSKPRRSHSSCRHVTTRSPLPSMRHHSTEPSAM
jgi:hypothetical protein